MSLKSFNVLRRGQKVESKYFACHKIRSLAFGQNTQNVCLHTCVHVHISVKLQKKIEHFEGNSCVMPATKANRTRMSVVIAFCESLTNYHTITSITNGTV